MSYKKVLKKLKALRSKRLIARAYKTREGRCALGVLSAFPQALNTVEISSLQFHTIHSYIQETYNCDYEELEALQSCNDRDPNETPKERYERVLAWLEAKVAKEGA